MSQEMGSRPAPPLPQSAPVTLGYATPFAAAHQPVAVWREGMDLVTLREAALPQLRVKCNAPADGQYIRRKFYWHHPAYALLIFVNVLVLLIVSLCVRKKAEVHVGLCKRHYTRRMLLLTMTWALALGAFPLLIAGIGMAGPRDDALIAATVIVFAVMLIAAVVTGILSRSLTPKRITEQGAWFKGCGADFLSQFPSTR